MILDISEKTCNDDLGYYEYDNFDDISEEMKDNNDDVEVWEWWNDPEWWGV